MGIPEIVKVTAQSETARPNKTAGYYECERAEMEAFVPQDVRTVLDIGCGAGAYGKYLKAKRAVQVWGVEIDPQIAQLATRALDHVVVGAFPDAVSLPERCFDLVQFNDVLEHMENPSAALTAAKRYLKAGGYVLASIPNVRYVSVLYNLGIRGEWSYSQCGVLDSTHLRFFTRKSMVQMFLHNGYDVSMVQGLYPLKRWQISLLRCCLPSFANDIRFIEYAILAKLRP